MNTKLAALALFALCTQSATLYAGATPVASGTSAKYTSSNILTLVHAAELLPVGPETPVYAPPPPPTPTPTYVAPVPSDTTTVFLPHCGPVLVRGTVEARCAL